MIRPLVIALVIGCSSGSNAPPGTGDGGGDAGADVMAEAQLKDGEADNPPALDGQPDNTPSADTTPETTLTPCPRLCGLPPTPGEYMETTGCSDPCRKRDDTTCCCERTNTCRTPLSPRSCC